jgi:glutaredoxin-like protein
LIPAIVLTGLQNGEEVDYGIRFYGIPAGYEFATLLEDILMISTGHHHLSPQVLDEVTKIDKPVDMMVFVTPTCPYCPRAVLTAHQFAFVNPNIRGAMIEAMEFEQLSQKWNVYGVPKTVINESGGVRRGHARQHGFALPRKCSGESVNGRRVLAPCASGGFLF